MMTIRTIRTSATTVLIAFLERRSDRSTVDSKELELRPMQKGGCYRGGQRGSFEGGLKSIVSGIWVVFLKLGMWVVFVMLVEE